jgi:hypothetical protein
MGTAAMVIADPNDLPVTWGLIGVVGSVASGTAFLAWFFSDQLRKNRGLFYRVVSRHNREDDDRFAALQSDLFNIRLRNARVDREEAPEFKPFTRRTYLIDDGETAS